MATIEKWIQTRADPARIWEAIGDIGALHTRLVPGFVLDTRLEAGARWVTFFDGTTIRERIVTRDDATRRLVWSADSPALAHHSSSVQVTIRDGLSCVRWVSDFLPDTAAGTIEPMMAAGARAMQGALDALVQKTA